MTRDRTHDGWGVTAELPVGRSCLFHYLLDGEEWLYEWRADDYVETDDGLGDSVVGLVNAGVPSGLLVLSHAEG